MAHFAELDSNNIVLRVITVHNNELIVDGVESEDKGIEFCKFLFPNRRWIQTSYNSSFRKNYAGIGYTYDAQRDAFITPRQYLSWVLNENTCQWEAPIPYPSDGKRYWWHEDVTQWLGYPTQPYPSWTLNVATNKWEAPIPYPADGKRYTWDETTQSWIERQ